MDEAGKSRLRWGLAIAFVLALTVVLVVRGVSGDPLLWTLDGRTISDGKYLRPTVWATGPTLAITRAQEVTGYDAATGERRWAVPLDGEVCAASARPAGDRVAVQFGPDRRRHCDRVALVDLKQGRKVWERPIPADGDPPKAGHVVIGDGAVVVGRLNGAAAFRPADGKPLWDVREGDEDCRFRGWLGGPVLVAGHACVSDGLNVRQVQRIDPGTGRPLWTYDVPAGYEVEGMVSHDPIVLGLRRDARRERMSRLEVLTPSGARTTSIGIAAQGAVECYGDPQPSNRCTDIVVTRDSVYVRSGTWPARDEDERTFGPIVAYDLPGGRARWATENPGGNHLFPIAMDGERLIAAQPSSVVGGGRGGSTTKPPRLVSVDPATGATSIMWNLTKKADFRLRSRSDRQYAQGRFFLTKELVTGKEEVAFRAYGEPGA